MIALERLRRVVDSAQKAVPSINECSPELRTCAPIVAPSMTKTLVSIRIYEAENMQPYRLLLKTKEHIKGAYAFYQMRSNIRAFVHSASRRDATLKMTQPVEFKITRQEFPIGIFGIPLRKGIDGERDSNNTGVDRGQNPRASYQ